MNFTPASGSAPKSQFPTWRKVGVQAQDQNWLHNLQMSDRASLTVLLTEKSGKIESVELSAMRRSQHVCGVSSLISNVMDMTLSGIQTEIPRESEKSHECRFQYCRGQESPLNAYYFSLYHWLSEMTPSVAISKHSEMISCPNWQGRSPHLYGPRSSCKPATTNHS
jgi:hypothetical protein